MRLGADLGAESCHARMRHAANFALPKRDSNAVGPIMPFGCATDESDFGAVHGREARQTVLETALARDDKTRI